jgi:hypothetical protein
LQQHAQQHAKAPAPPMAPKIPARQTGSSHLGNQARLRRLAAHTSTASGGLRVGAVEDPLEREADAVADRVMRMPAAGVSATRVSPRLTRKCATCEAQANREETSATHPVMHMRDATISNATPHLYRKCAACQEEEKIQRQQEGAECAADHCDVQNGPERWDGLAAPASVDGVLASPGAPLDRETRAFFEPRFGRDLASVRVHADARASLSARELGARAYTVGSDIVFATGAYAPSTGAGRRLVAHELAHVVQQGGSAGVVRRRVDPHASPPAPPLSPAAQAIMAKYEGLRSSYHETLSHFTGDYVRGQLYTADRDAVIDLEFDSVKRQITMEDSGVPDNKALQAVNDRLFDDLTKILSRPEYHNRIGDILGAGRKASDDFDFLLNAIPYEEEPGDYPTPANPLDMPQSAGQGLSAASA